ncbi:6359_t:CDS:2, partial [Racocetra fulgida]
GQISLPNDRGSSEVTDIISDTKLKIKKEFKDLKALEMLTQPEGTTYKCLPHIDQSKVYKAVFEVLNAGGCVGIFPEGGTGVTIMALGAMAANPKLNVKIVPCGLNYFHAHQFRSRAVVEFGSPISIPRDLVGKYSKGGQNKRDACSNLLEIIYNGLKSVTVNTPDYETLMAARRLYKPEHHKLELPEVMELNRRFVGGYMNFKDDSRVQKMNKEVMAYNQLLKYYGLKDHQVQRTAHEAVKSSTVKIAGRDVLATWKLLVALEQLAYDLTELINELGPKIYPDFDNARIVQEADDSDYDDVFFFLDKHNGGKITGRSRSNSSSSRKLSSGRDGTSSSASLSRVNSFNSLNSFNSNVEAFTKLSSTSTIPSYNIPEVRIIDDDGYQGDKENSIQTKKNV